MQCELLRSMLCLARGRRPSTSWAAAASSITADPHALVNQPREAGRLAELPVNLLYCELLADLQACQSPSSPV